MPRLGDDPNVATAYPSRLQTNLRGSWLRQLLTTAIGSLCLLFFMNNIVKTNYETATKESMKEKGMEDKIDNIIPKTPREKRRDAEMAKMTQGQIVETMQDELGDLTNSVLEIQKLLAKTTGVTLQYPVQVAPEDEEDENAAVQVKADGEGGGEDGTGAGGGGSDGGSGGKTTNLGLRGAEDAQQPVGEAGEAGEVVGSGDSGDVADLVDAAAAGSSDAARGGEDGQRLLLEEEEEEEEQAGGQGGNVVGVRRLRR